MNLSFDEDLYPILNKIIPNFDEAVWLQDHVRIAHEEREQFLNNDIENPLFTYSSQIPRIEYVERVDTFSQHLQNSKAPAVVIDLYERKFEKQKLRNSLIAASVERKDKHFFEVSCSLYGKPRIKYFSYVSKRVLDLCHEQKSAFPGSARRLRKVLAKINSKDNDIDVTVLPPLVTDGTPITLAKEVEKIFREVLDRCDIKDWAIKIDGEGMHSRFSVNPYTKVILIPSDEQLQNRLKPLIDVHVYALAEHEIGVHVRRAYEASKGPLKLLEIGLDNYLMGEEGLAGYVQQQIEGADEYYGFDRYLAASLAVGMDGEKRDFRAVFSLMTDYYTLKLASNNTSSTAPFRAAWDVCVRIFRGTSGQTAGCIYTKDIVYMEGNIGLWNLLSERPQVFESLFIGKYNPLLKRHVQTLQTLEILKDW